MNIAKRLSERAEKLLFRAACATCPLQNSCGGACIKETSPAKSAAGKQVKDQKTKA